MKINHLICNLWNVSTLFYYMRFIHDLTREKIKFTNRENSYCLLDIIGTMKIEKRPHSIQKKFSGSIKAIIL